MSEPFAPISLLWLREGLVGPRIPSDPLPSLAGLAGGTQQQPEADDSSRLEHEQGRP